MNKLNSIVIVLFLVILLVPLSLAEPLAIRAEADAGSASKILLSAVMRSASEEKVIGIGAGITNGSQPEDSFDTLLEDDDIVFLQDRKVSFNDGAGYDTYDVTEIVALGADSPSIETALSKEAVDKNYGSDIAMEIGVDSVFYYYVFGDAVNLSLVTEDDPLEIDFLGHHLKITSVDYDELGNANRINVKLGDDKFMKYGDAVTISSHTIKLENVAREKVAVSVDGGEIVSINEGSTYSWKEGIEVHADTVFYKSGNPEGSAAILIIGSSATKTYEDEDAFIGEDENDEDWRWELANLDADAKTTVTSAGVATGPVIAVKNHFVAQSSSADDPPVVRNSGCYPLTIGSGAQLCMNGETVYDYFKIEVDVTDVDLAQIEETDTLMNGGVSWLPSSMSMLRIRAKPLTRTCSEIREEDECNEGVACSSDAQCMWDSAKEKCGCYQLCGLPGRGTPTAGETKTKGATCSITSKCPTGETCEVSSSQDTCVCSAGVEEDQYVEPISFTPLKLNIDGFPNRVAWMEGTTLTSDTETDEIFIYKYYCCGGCLACGAGEPEIYLFYTDPETNDITYFGNLTGTANRQGGFRLAYVNYEDTKDEDVSLYFRSGNGTDNYVNISVNSEEIPNVSDNISIYLYNDTRTTPGLTGFYGITNEFTHIGPTANTEEAVDIWHVNDVHNSGIGLSDADLRNEYGIIVKNPEEYCSEDKIELLIPADAVRTKISIMSSGGVLRGETSSLIPSINLAKSDAEIINASEILEDSVIIGGPAANKWAAYFMEKDFPTDGGQLGWKDGWCMIQNFERDFVEVKVIAGWDAEDTSDCVDKYLSGVLMYNNVIA